MSVTKYEVENITSYAKDVRLSLFKFDSGESPINPIQGEYSNIEIIPALIGFSAWYSGYDSEHSQQMLNGINKFLTEKYNGRSEYKKHFKKLESNFSLVGHLDESFTPMLNIILEGYWGWDCKEEPNGGLDITKAKVSFVAFILEKQQSGFAIGHHSKDPFYGKIMDYILIEPETYTGEYNNPECYKQKIIDKIKDICGFDVSLQLNYQTQ